MRIRIKLSKRSIQEAIKQTKAQEAHLREKADLMAKRLAQEGVLAARNAIVGYGAVDTSDLLGAVRYEPVKPGIWKVTCFVPNGEGQNYAWFVEYGTGVVGAASPHPEAGAAGWNYDINGHGEDGWFYPYGKSNKHKFRFNPETGKYQPWTDGEPAKPFMYDSRQHITSDDVVNRIFKEVFGS